MNPTPIQDPDLATILRALDDLQRRRAFEVSFERALDRLGKPVERVASTTIVLDTKPGHDDDWASGTHRRRQLRDSLHEHVVVDDDDDDGGDDSGSSPPASGGDGGFSVVSGVGIDLSTYYIDIRRLTSAIGLRACVANGWDLEDLIADVVVRVAIRNRGRCPWDRAKGTLGNYLYRVIQQTILNKWRNQSRFVALHRATELDVASRTVPSKERWQPDALDDATDVGRAISALPDDLRAIVERMMEHDAEAGPRSKLSWNKVTRAAGAPTSWTRREAFAELREAMLS